MKLWSVEFTRETETEAFVVAETKEEAGVLARKVSRELLDDCLDCSDSTYVRTEAAKLDELDPHEVVLVGGEWVELSKVRGSLETLLTWKGTPPIPHIDGQQSLLGPRQ